VPGAKAIIPSRSRGAIAVSVISGTNMNWPSFTIALRKNKGINEGEDL